MTATTQPEIHPHLGPVAFLLGTWRGGGDGRLHEGEPFPYEEEVRFTHRGRPWLVYEQRAWAPQDESLLHTEMGFWRPDEGAVWAFVSLTGGSDFSYGVLDGTTVSFESRQAPMADGIEPVVGLRRAYEVDGDVLSYEIEMTTEGHPTERHIGGTLRRVLPHQRGSSGRSA